jgi:cell division GTPase FtsZ
MQDQPQKHCSDFSKVVRAGLPVNSSSQGRDVRGRFLRDVVHTYKNPIVGIDIEDLEVVFRGVRSPALGVGVASGNYRPQRAAQQAFQAAGGRSAAHALIVVAFALGDMRNGEGKIAAREIYQHMDPDCFINIGLIEDEQISRGTIRVSVLLG